MITMEADLLGEPYRRRTLELPADNEGEVVATLVTRDDSPSTGPAVLYVHGFSDYFFHPHVADFFVEQGYAFYALDLRKAGRSMRPHQTPHFVRYIPEYFAELDLASRLIRSAGHDSILVYGHSTGGLSTSLWAHRMRQHPWLSGLILNSPFFALNIGEAAQRLGTVPLDIAGLLAPKQVLPRGGPGINVQSLHRDHHGEWDFDLAWKPLAGTPIRLGWLRAVDQAQKRVRSGLEISAPVLVTAAAESWFESEWNETAHTADTVLNVEDIVRWAPGLGDDVEVVQIHGGRHDLALSQLGARKLFFSEVDAWMRRHHLLP
ncbi:alpha-beta hydrolase superfamily lysophospholipase [Stackebrandtia endophytica]|uniref:Alpha-beta hydrolase superfamily lysophospholipase n=2 Tax=Stackebrandtia endophytica TaxID=1496996 RepID=A0A543AQ87_9ACTN|nr:alpha-beta hydrolase superfamily lysophospholipase [Stackebrandtia endophytica]